MTSTAERLPAPLKVAPVIKFFRWTFLISGIFYGVYHYNRIKGIEHALREREIRERPMREAKLRAEREIASKKSLDELMKLL